MLTLGLAKTKALQYIREYSNNGNLISASTDADYTLSFNNAADTAQKEVATVKPIFGQYSLSQNPIRNLIGLLQGFDLQQHLDIDLIDTQAVGAKAYYFEVDRQCAVYIEESTGAGWVVLATITVPSTVTSFTAYKGLITPSSASNMVRIRFSGAYPYSIRNRCLYGYTFPTTVDIPDYTPHVKYTMPADFRKLVNIVRRFDTRQYQSLSDYFWEGKRTLVLNYYVNGSFDIFYEKYPADITSATDDAYEFEVDPDAAEAIPFYMGAMAIINEDASVSTVLMNLYQSKLTNLDTVDKGVTTIQADNRPWW